MARGRLTMAYGHAERTLAAIRLLEAETTDLLLSLPQLNAEQLTWLRERTQACRRPASGLRPNGDADAPTDHRRHRTAPAA